MFLHKFIFLPWYHHYDKNRSNTMENVTAQSEFLKWKIYQIYPRSFFDSNGDGIGDLNGITEKLAHLKELGVNAVWLSPCYKSPNDDNGYDISNFYDIMDDFGTMEDWKNMIAKMHEMGIKLIMDLVPNHTSTAHPFFQESRKGKDNPYSDFYYWYDNPPNDWGSIFGGSAWQYDEVRKQYYLHSYAVSQADLNWNNPRVREEMLKIIDFWVDLGVDGFRIDVIDQISKNMDGENAFGPHLHDYIKEMFGREKTKHLFTVGECWVDNEEEILRHCHPSRKELVTLFQFDHFDKVRKGKFTRNVDRLYDMNKVREVLVKWQEFTEKEGIIYTLFTDNHDQPRFISRMLKDESLRYEASTMLATMFYLLRGVPFVFQGQEIGILNSKYYDLKDYRDIETINFYHDNKEKYSAQELSEMIYNGSRDNARRPMPWSSDLYGGFSKMAPWITPNMDYKTINVDADKQSDKSIFRFYQSVLKLKEEDVFTFGEFKNLTEDRSDCFIYQRSYNNQQFVVVANFEKAQSIELPFNFEKVILTNYENSTNTYKPYEVRVYKLACTSEL